MKHISDLWQKSKGIHWVLLFNNRNMIVYFDSFQIEYIPWDMLNKRKDKSITHNIFRIQPDDYIILL